MIKNQIINTTQLLVYFRGFTFHLCFHHLEVLHLPLQPAAHLLRLQHYWTNLNISNIFIFCNSFRHYARSTICARHRRLQRSFNRLLKVSGQKFHELSLGVVSVFQNVSCVVFVVDTAGEGEDDDEQWQEVVVYRYIHEVGDVVDHQHCGVSHLSPA